MPNYTHVSKGFEPFYNKDSEILILGSYPSVKSREEGFYYGNKYNRFWKVLAILFDDKLPVTIEEKKHFLTVNRIALWDVIAECDIVGSSDASIKNVVVNDINRLLKSSNIKKVVANGNLAFELYEKYGNQFQLRPTKLPSTSPANATFTIDKLIEKWKYISE